MLLADKFTHILKWNFILPSLRKQGAGCRHHEDQTVKIQRRWVRGFSFQVWWNLCGDQINSEPLSCSPLYLQHSHQHHLNRSVQISDPLHELVFFQPLHDDGQDYWQEGGEERRRGVQKDNLVLLEDCLNSAAWRLLTHSWCGHGDSGDDHLRNALRRRSLPQRQRHTELISNKLTEEMPVFWFERSPASRPWSCLTCCRSRPSLQCHSVFPWKG